MRLTLAGLNHSKSNGTDYIVLGWPIMANFYTVFEKLNNTATVSVYVVAVDTADDDSSTPENTNTKKETPTPVEDNSWIYLALFVAVGAIGAIIYYYYLKKGMPIGASAIQPLNMELKRASASS